GSCRTRWVPKTGRVRSGGSGLLLISWPLTERNGGSSGNALLNHSEVQPVAETTKRGSTLPTEVSTATTRPFWWTSDLAATPDAMPAPLRRAARANDNDALTGGRCASDG